MGDPVNVTCYSRGSSPPASLSWKVNDNKIYDESSREKPVRPERSQLEQYQYQYDNEATSYTLVQPKVAQPQFVFGTIRDWFEKFDSPNSKLDTAASNLHFYVQDHHKHTGDQRDDGDDDDDDVEGLKLECTASIGPVYWHETTESSSVVDRAPDYTSWISSGHSKTCLSSLTVGCILLLLLLRDSVAFNALSEPRQTSFYC